MCFTIPGSKRKPPTQRTITMYYRECFYRGAMRRATGDILAAKRPIRPPLLQRSDLLSSVLKGNSLHIFVAMHFCTNDVTQHKLPHDLTRQIFLGSHCRMCYVRNASSSQDNCVYVHCHLQSVPSAVCTISDLLWLPSAAHGIGLQPHRQQYRADKRGLSLCVTSQI